LNLTLCKNRLKQNFYIHRLVAQAFIENCDEKDFVNHKDLDKTNNNPSNLEWVTHSENIIHMYDKTNNNPSNLEWVTHSENIIHMYEEKGKERIEKEREKKII
jgi:ribosomal protein L24E